MLNTLIADDNIMYTKRLVNNIISKINNIKIASICTDGKETLNIISNNVFDLILLDLQMPNLNGFEIIEEIKRLTLIKKPKVIIISGDLPLLKYARLDGIVYNVILKTDSDEDIYRKISCIVDEIKYTEHYDDIKAKTISILKEMGYSLKHKGTKYMIEAIMYVYGNNNPNMLDNLEKNVYSYVAHRYNNSIENIKTNIIKSTRLVEVNNIHLSPKDVINEVIVNL